MQEVSTKIVMSWLLYVLESEALLSVVDFNAVKATRKCPLDSGDPSFLHILNVRFRHLLGMRQSITVRDGAWGIDIIGPAIHLS